jgi:hypothetical protein
MVIAHAPSPIYYKDVLGPNEVVFSIVGLMNSIYNFVAPSVEIQDLIDLYNSFPLFQNYCADISNHEEENLFERERHIRDRLNSGYDFKISSIKKDIARVREMLNRMDASDIKNSTALYDTLIALEKFLVDLEERKSALELKPLAEDEILRLIDLKICEKMEAGHL